MAHEYAVNRADLTAVADAIRAKGSTAAALSFPAEFVAAIGAISAGALNFTVTGGLSRPESPANNAIWVNTSQEITGWAFSADEPDAPADGMVWFRTALESSVAFNALTEETLQVCPVSARQYMGGVWISRRAWSYADGQWIQWATYLYNAGDMCAELSGGWSADGYYASSGTKVKAGVVNPDYLYMGAAGSSAITVMATQNAIDLTGINYLHFSASLTVNGHNGSFRVCQTKDLSTPAATNVVKSNMNGVSTLDVRALSGRFYVIAMTSGNAVMDLTSVEVEWA